MKYCKSCGKEAENEVEMCNQCNGLIFVNIPVKKENIGELVYAGFWIRALALIIDDFICIGLYCIIILPLGFGGVLDKINYEMIQILGYSLIIVIYIFYYTFFVGKYGGTLGKRILGLRIISTSTNEKISYGLAFGRLLASKLSGIILFIGYIVVAFDKEKASWHDSLCGTRVIRIR